MQPRIQKKQESFIIKNRIELLLGVVIVLFLVIIYFQFNPPYINRLSKNLQVIDEVSNKTGADASDATAIRKIEDVNALRSQNTIMAEVYKDAQNGDYFIAFEDRIVIYREETDEIIYDGPSPSQIFTERQRELQEREQQTRAAIAEKARQLGFSFSDEEQITLSAIDNLADLQSRYPTFYQNAQVGDLVAIWPDSGIIIIYRPSNDTIINSGTFNTTIG